MLRLTVKVTLADLMPPDAVLAQAGARGISNAIVRHLRRKPANRRGFPSSGYWADAAPLVKQILHPTNTLSSITCSGGVGSDAPSGKWVLPGDVLLWDGTAKGRVTVILER